MKGASRIKSYTGFAIKAGKAVFGVDNILKVKNINLIIADNELSDNSKRKLLNFANRYGVEYHLLDMKEIVSKENCKAIGLKEKNLAQAIIQVIKESK